MNIEKLMVIGIIGIVIVLFTFEFFLIRIERGQDKAELSLLIRELDTKHRKYEVELKREITASILVRSNNGGIR